ncbi:MULTISPECIES: hypothetical protein [unclassified Tatumella]|uniref:hypothetical protein n=1 Tax=unclassified Tatumella TaxID=2649542 RepID=UPI001BAFADD8|nr:MULTISPECIES: hypothetical protein [unclassified Tatumella]MBS0857675.1 hypothetical protein [Tatumella sp. JGM16]MBS0914374.1 hypothetical protein [Tatumella sp. JGM91]
MALTSEVEKIFRKIHSQFKIRNPECNRIEMLTGVLDKYAGAGNYFVTPAVIMATEDIRGYCVVINNCRGFIPETAALALKSNLLVAIGAEFSAAEIILPLYFSMGEIEAHSADILTGTTREQKLELGNRALMTLLNIDALSRLATGHYPLYSTLESCHIQIRETVELYSLGYIRSAITTLLPCIEHAIRALGIKVGIKNPETVKTADLAEIYSAWFKFYINQVVFKDYDWKPQSVREISYFSGFDERIQIGSIGLNYFRNNLYQHSSSDDGISGLNRHSILHGFMPNYFTDANYLRLINFLNNICFMISFTGDNFSNFFPSQTSESKVFTRHLYKLQEIGAARARLLDEMEMTR